VLELLQIFVDNIAPILIISAVGYFIGRRLGVDPKPVGRILFNVLSPSLVFQSISTSEITGGEVAQIILVMGVFVAFMASTAYFIMRWRGVNKLERASVMLGATCANNGNFGLPLISFAFGPEVFARAVIVYIAITFFNYTTGVFIASSGRKSPREAAYNILFVPAIYAATAGLAVNYLGLTLPPVLARPVLLLSQATIPMMLLLLGLQMAKSVAVTHVKLVSLGVGLRLFISPFVATVLVLLVGLNAPAAVAVILQASMPIAVVTIIFASEFELDHQLALSMILASTLLSPVTLSVLIFVLRRWYPALALG
jgi:predicted permease